MKMRLLNSKRAAGLTFLLAMTVLAETAQAPKPFRLNAEFSGWSGNAAIFHFEGDDQHPERWYRVAVNQPVPAIQIPRATRSLPMGTVLYQAHVGPDPRDVQFAANCNPDQKRILNDKLTEFDRALEKPGVGKQELEKLRNAFPTVHCTIHISYGSGQTGAHLLWKGERRVGPYSGEATYTYEDPAFDSAFLSPDGHTLLIGWTESDSSVYIFLPLSSREK